MKQNLVPLTRKAKGKRYKLLISKEKETVWNESKADNMVAEIKSLGGDAFKYPIYEGVFAVYYRVKK